MTRVLLTGGSGFVGANLARRLLRDGHEVHCLLRRGHRSWRLDDIRRSIVTHDAGLGDPTAVRDAVRRVRPQWLFHLATYGASAGQDDLDIAVRTNLLATIDLVRAALDAGCESFVNTGSSSEYGVADHPTSETEAPEPNSWYAVTKASATLFCGYVARRERRNVTTLRPYSVYGPYEEPSRLMPALILAGLEGRLPPLVDPSVARDYVYVDDVCDAYVAAARRPPDEPGGIYNVATGVQTSMRDLVALARRVLGVTTQPAWGSMPNRRGDTSVWVGDPGRIEQDLGWTATHEIESGFCAMVDWFRAEPGRISAYHAMRT